MKPETYNYHNPNNGASVKVGDLVQKMNPWKVYNDWMDFDNDDEPILVLRVAECETTVLLRHLWTGVERWDTCTYYEVISEGR